MLFTKKVSRAKISEILLRLTAVCFDLKSNYRHFRTSLRNISKPTGERKTSRNQFCSQFTSLSFMQKSFFFENALLYGKMRNV